MNLWPPRFARYLVTHPRDVPVVIAAAWALRRTGWWRRTPFLPVPDDAYWQFRLATFGGSPTPQLDPREVVEAAKWSRRQRSTR